MTKQTIFNKVVRHLRQQGERAVDPETQNCAYLAPDGKKCAVGCLISKKNYKPAMENKKINWISWSGCMPEHLKEHVGLLVALQQVHDSIEPKNWETEWAALAARTNLKMPQ